MKKDLNYYMGLNYKIEILKADEGEGYVLHCPELKGCVTCADTVEQGIKMIEDAKKCWVTACLEDNISIPEPNDCSDYSGQFKIRIPKSLHKSLAERSRQEGVSMNQLCMYLLSSGTGTAQSQQRQ